MRVRTEDLIPGCIISEDVYKQGATPIVKKNTTLSQLHIDMLHVFFINDVPIEAKLKNGRMYTPNGVLYEEKPEEEVPSDVKEEKNLSFTTRYLDAVNEYKKLFHHWQGGAKVDPLAVRQLFLGLIEVLPTKKELNDLYRLSLKKDYLYFHSVSVALISFLLGKKLSIKEGELIQLGIAGLLSDAGMAKIHSDIWMKNGELLEREFAEVQQHPLYSYRMLEEVKGISQQALLGVLQHHEREDGNGYPLKAKGDKIHLFAKIIGVVDIYHAMTTDRVYRKRQTSYQVFEKLVKDEFGKLDAVVVKQLSRLLLDLDIGKKVRLSNGEVGEIVYLQDHEPTRPILRMSSNDELFKLSSTPHIYIECEAGEE
ncbi:HD-GYP domain-containing protein [Alteribacter populi]|uniref:HD-GYP domain-containing protein n=1 Tax=Alteribacter populi TaxID=2011011 RepID=UPI000BBABB18|nr:HD-GYP domain-containing protein [Alteribacter populi]